jgi:hypothetical protein
MQSECVGKDLNTSHTILIFMKARPFQKLYQMGLINLAQEEIATINLTEEETGLDEEEPKSLNTLMRISQSRRIE